MARTKIVLSQKHDCVHFVSFLLDSTAGNCGHLIDVLMLVLHGGAHGRVSHAIHDREQVFGCRYWFYGADCRLEAQLGYLERL